MCVLRITLMFNYWSMPAPIQKAIAACIPTKDSWEINATKTDMQDWVFDIPPFVKDEALCGGTEFIIDTYYIQVKGEAPSVGDTINMKVTANKPKQYDACCTDFVTDDEAGFGHSYTEVNTQMEGWFCPMFEVMFGNDIPKAVYIQFS